MAFLVALVSALRRTPVAPGLVVLGDLSIQGNIKPVRSLVEPLVQMVAPVAPHIADELWERMGHRGSLALGPFPVADPALLVEDTVTCVIQIKGKVRDRVDVPADISESDLRELALAREKVLAATTDGIRTVIVRPPTLVNVVPM